MSRREDSSAGAENVGHSNTQLLMEEVVKEENLRHAYSRVLRNGGAPGPDGLTVDALGEYLKQNVASLREDLLAGRYRPQAIRSVTIPKPSGGTRELGIPNVVDRMVQQALLQVLTPVFDPSFSESSHGFRPGRSQHGALGQALGHIRAGFTWVVNTDLRRFFDTVQHDVLMARVARKVRDKRVLQLIGRFLRAGLMRGGVLSPRAQGTPQGGPLSPILSNILLDELDKELERRGHRFVRYADDFLIFKRTQRAAWRTEVAVRRFLAKELRLQVNEKKSSIERPETLTYLGFAFVRIKDRFELVVSPQSVRRLKERLRRDLTTWGRGRSIRATVRIVTARLRGWFNYFRGARLSRPFGLLDKWIRRRLRCLIWRSWGKYPGRRYRGLLALGLGRESALNICHTRKGPWRIANSPPLKNAIRNRYLHEDLGLFNLHEAHRQFRGTLLNRRIPSGTSGGVGAGEG